MQVIADAAGMEMHTAKLSMLPEPKLTIPKLIAIAFIKFHREIKKRNKQLVEADFNVLRLERDDATWMSGGSVVVNGAAGRKKKKDNGKNPVAMTNCNIVVCNMVPPQI